MSSERNGLRGLLLGATVLAGAFALPVTAHAEARMYSFSIPAKDLGSALRDYGAASGQRIMFSEAVAQTRRAPALRGNYTANEALDKLLADTGLVAKRTAAGVIIIAEAPREERPAMHARSTLRAPLTPLAAETVSGSAVEGLVVTAQKRREAIQDVPIAISAFSADALQAQKIEGGFDLLKAIPNVTFSKNNFSGYNFSIRGIGTKAVSVTTDPGVAVEFNDTPLIRNRLFEQEYFDVERVEVLRGPQGTLHGRNATSGVINVISEKADLEEFVGKIKGEAGNYHTKRLSGFVNVPLIDDVLGVRFAGALTQREGYDFNLYNDENVNGRDLWSGRLSIGFAPTERLHADFIWERFNENDDRSRTGKQLCTHDPAPSQVGAFDFAVLEGLTFDAWSRGHLTQGCLPGSLYDDAAFGTPNGYAIPFTIPLQGLPVDGHRPLKPNDPYGNRTQSRDLRELYSKIVPIYRAKSDIFELNIGFDLSVSLTLTAQTAYAKDEIYSSQDFNRYTTDPVIEDSSMWMSFSDPNEPSVFRTLSPGGFFCDPQVGCSNTIVGRDLSRARSSQFSQEIRLQSDFDGPWNFSAGINYLRYNTVEDYYVFFNGATLVAITALNSGFFGGGLTGYPEDKRGLDPDCNLFNYLFTCVPIENNPIENIQDTGHNYFLSRNPYRLDSRAAFGELYFDFSENIKITAGLRYTDDSKTTTPIPSELLLTDPSSLITRFPDISPLLKGIPLFGLGSGYPRLPDVERQWQEVTGRLGVDWKPDLSFTDESLLYAFYSRGYKGGGLNPPRIGLNYDTAAELGIPFADTAPPDFRPEFVDAFEIGAKNTILGGGLVFNASAFFYDYQDYQVSKIVDRSANNENFDAMVWGLEFESIFAPTENLRLNASLGYLDTELADGSRSIDIMNRTAGHTDWIVLKPAITLTSNCIAPLEFVESLLVRDFATGPGQVAGIVGDLLPALCPSGGLNGTNFRGDGNENSAAGQVGFAYDPRDFPEANYGAGFFTDVSGNELPNSPHFTVSLGAEYGWDLLDGNWRATVRGDAYWQSQSWARVYELPIDKLHAWYNANLSLWIEKPEDDLKFEFYIKNVLDDTPITDTFLNSDDTALTTNIFTLDPRLIGLQVTKGF